MGQLDTEFYEERKFSDPHQWAVSINWDDEPDGSNGGYDSHGNYVVPEAMMELVMLRETVYNLSQQLEEASALIEVGPVLDREAR